MSDIPSLSPDLAAAIGVIGPEYAEPEPTTQMDYALHWQRRSIYVFPCERFLGTPLIPKWHSAASTTVSTIVDWWSQWPDADIAGVPDRSGRFVIVATREQGGHIALMDLEDEHGELPAEFRYENRWGDEFLWLRGSAMTSHHKLGRGLHVLGAGHYVYLPDSWAPAPDHYWK